MYLPDRQMRLPLRLPSPRQLSPLQFDLLLEAGDRRSGPLLYRPDCAHCEACEAIRIPVARFEPTRSQRRSVKKNLDVDAGLGPALLDDTRLGLYNRHKRERGLARREGDATARDYHFFLLETCVDTREFRYYVGDRLIAVSILDLGFRGVSSVYHYFDPDEAARSIGVYSVLREIAYCREEGFEWYYLGLYVSDCQHLRYKADYYPHQRRRFGVWREYSGPDDHEGVEVDPLTGHPASRG